MNNNEADDQLERVVMVLGEDGLIEFSELEENIDRIERIARTIITEHPAETATAIAWRVVRAYNGGNR